MCKTMLDVLLFNSDHQFMDFIGVCSWQGWQYIHSLNSHAPCGSRILILLSTLLGCKKAHIMINVFLGMKVKVTWEQVCLAGEQAMPHLSCHCWSHNGKMMFRDSRTETCICTSAWLAISYCIICLYPLDSKKFPLFLLIYRIKSKLENELCGWFQQQVLL